MKSVLASLAPYYYYLIGEGIKKIEARKNVPKDPTWSKGTWLYMTKDEQSFSKIPKEFQEKYRKHFGRVGLHFVCDQQVWLLAHPSIFAGHPLFYSKAIEDACLTRDEVERYSGGKNVIGWHISDLKIYDEPKELIEFCIWKKCNSCRDTGYESTACRYDEDCRVPSVITRPPQSWCYVEERSAT